MADTSQPLSEEARKVVRQLRCSHIPIDGTHFRTCRDCGLQWWVDQCPGRKVRNLAATFIERQHKEVTPAWQPIETAPRDGTRVLLGDDGRHPPHRPWTSEGQHFDDPEGWWLAGTDPWDAHDGQVYPTHWAPLPAPPAALSEETACASPEPKEGE